MRKIDTSLKGWQKEMATCMKNEEMFTIATTNNNLADVFKKNDFRVGAMKVLLMGSGTGATVTGMSGAGGVVVGLSGIAGIAATSTLFAVADPEPISKTVFAIVATIVVIILKMFLDRKYKFSMKQTPNSWTIEANPV